MRCFIAIDLPNEIEHELSKVQDRIYSNDSKIVNVKPENMHITLKFLGEINEDSIEKVKDAMESIKSQKFRARLDCLGIFPNKNFIRVVWVGIEPKEKINELHSLLDEALERRGFGKDSGFENHATLSRVKIIKDRKAFIEQLDKIKLQHLEFDVNSIVLKKSLLSSVGSTYEDLFEMKLA